MITTLQVAAQVPAYCTSGHGVLSPAQWATCVKAGWNEPTTGAANAGAAFGHTGAPILIIALIIVAALVLASKSGSRKPATDS